MSVCGASEKGASVSNRPPCFVCGAHQRQCSASGEPSSPVSTSFEMEFEYEFLFIIMFTKG